MNVTAERTYTSMVQIDDLDKAKIMVTQQHERGNKSAYEIRAWAEVVWSRRLRADFYYRAENEPHYVKATLGAGLILIAVKLLSEEGKIS